MNELLSDEEKSRLWQRPIIISLEDEYGAERVEKVFEKVETYDPASGRRNIYYVTWLVKN